MTQSMFEQVSDLVQQNKLESSGPYGGEKPSTHRYDDRGHGRIYHNFPREETWRWIPGSQRIGGFGLVWMVTSAKETEASDHHLRAVKQIRKATDGSRPLLRASRELEAAFKFSGNEFAPRFVRSYGWFEDTDYVFLAMEYLKHGDLRSFMSQPLPETTVKRITSQLVDGLSYMHQNGFIHRDLKPANVLVVEPHPEWKVKLGDFGISKFINRDSKLETSIGTLQYMAPEIRGNGSTYTSAVDMWSLGITVFQMLTMELHMLNGKEPLKREPLLDRGVGKPCQDFLEEILVGGPDQRMSSESATSHPWIQLQGITSSANALVGGTPITSSTARDESVPSGNFCSKPKSDLKPVSPQHDTPAVEASKRKDKNSSETSECNQYTVDLMGRKGPILKFSFKLAWKLEFDDLHDRLGLQLAWMGKQMDGNDVKLSYVDKTYGIRKALENDRDLSQALEQDEHLYLYLEQPEQSLPPKQPRTATLRKTTTAPQPKAQALGLQEQREESSLDSPPSLGQVGKKVQPLEQVVSRNNPQGTERLVASPDASGREVLVATQPWTDSQGILKIKSSHHSALAEPASSMAVTVNRYIRKRCKGGAEDGESRRNAAQRRDTAKGDDARRRYKPKKKIDQPGSRLIRFLQKCFGSKNPGSGR